MEIGDEVHFDKYLPLDEAGNFKDIKYKIRLLTIDSNGNFVPTSTIRTKRVPKVITQLTSDNTVIYKTMKLDTIGLKSGKFLGTFRKKLERTYRSSAVQVVEQNRMPPTEVRRTIRPFTSRERYSNNPYRLDNPRSLSTLAIIATSNRKRYVVDMNDLNRCNLQRKIKIL